jgi:hypothetical protein
MLMLMVEVLRSILWVGKEKQRKKQWDLTAWIHLLAICADCLPTTRVAT